MWPIAKKDLPEVTRAVNRIVELLNGYEVKSLRIDVNLGDGIKPIEVVGYRVKGALRIDIKVDQGKG